MCPPGYLRGAREGAPPLRFGCGYRIQTRNRWAIGSNAAPFGPPFESLTRQSIPAHESLVVDDESVDDTARIARELGATVISGQALRLLRRSGHPAPRQTFFDLYRAPNNRP